MFAENSRTDVIEKKHQRQTSPEDLQKEGRFGCSIWARIAADWAEPKAAAARQLKDAESILMQLEFPVGMYSVLLFHAVKQRSLPYLWCLLLTGLSSMQRKTHLSTVLEFYNDNDKKGQVENVGLEKVQKLQAGKKWNYVQLVRFHRPQFRCCSILLHSLCSLHCALFRLVPLLLLVHGHLYRMSTSQSLHQISLHQDALRCGKSMIYSKLFKPFPKPSASCIKRWVGEPQCLNLSAGLDTSTSNANDVKPWSYATTTRKRLESDSNQTRIRFERQKLHCCQAALRRSWLCLPLTHHQCAT